MVGVVVHDSWKISFQKDKHRPGRSWGLKMAYFLLWHLVYINTPKNICSFVACQRSSLNHTPPLLYLYPCVPSPRQPHHHPPRDKTGGSGHCISIYIYICMFLRLGALNKIWMLLDEFIFVLGCSIKATQHRPKGQETNISSPTQAAAGFIIFQISVCTRQP